MVDRDFETHVRRQLRILQQVVGSPSDAALARRSGVAPATFSEVLSGKRRIREEFVSKVVAGCLTFARERGFAPVDEQRVLRALRLPGHTATDAGILERDADLNRCSAVLAAVRSRAGGTMVIEGPAGIGKSELLARVQAEAAVRGMVPLGTRGSERGRALPFGAARSLLARWVASHSQREQELLFAGPAAMARIPLGLALHPHATTSSASPDNVIGLIEALYWLVVNATSRSTADRSGHEGHGLLLAVDDAHWLDEESLNWLRFLCDGLASLPVVVVMAYRPHEPQPVPILTQIALRATEVVRPRPLSREAIRIIVERMLPRPQRQPADDRFCAEVLRRSGGNPFYLRWMLNLAIERGLTPTAGAADQVHTLTPQHTVLYLRERLAALGRTAQRLAESIAVLGPGCSIEHAGRLAGLTAPEAKHDYDRLCHAAILSAGPTVDFYHPIIRSAVYDNIDPSVRSDMHREAARLLSEFHAPLDQVSLDGVAGHLLEVHATGDPWVVQVLETAAQNALARGLSATAARYLQRAVAEPPPAPQRGRIRLRYGQALALGPIAAALPHLLAAYEQATDETLRAQAAYSLAKTYSYADRLGDAVRLLESAIKDCADERWRQRLLVEQLVWANWWTNDPHRLRRMRQTEALASQLTGATREHRMLLTLHAWNQLRRGEPRERGLATIRPVIDAGLEFADLEDGMEVGTMAAFIPMLSGDPALARELFTQAVHDLEQGGWRGTHLAFAHTHLGNCALRQGRLADAVAEADIALRLADRAGQHTPAHWFATGTLIQAYLARGEVEQAKAVCAQRSYAGRQPDALMLPVPQAVYGALQLASAATTQAVATLRAIGAWLDDVHLTNPAWCPWRFDLALALRRTAPREAEEIATVALGQADRFGCPATRGRARRTLAALRPAAAALPLLRESADLLREAPDRFEYALTLADLGVALVRTGRPDDARPILSEAAFLADECGALGLHARVTRHLAAIGAPITPRHRVNDLHPRQRRAAQLAAQGHSDPEIAHAMVLDLDTIGTLLREASQRLRVESRAQLGRALAFDSSPTGTDR